MGSFREKNREGVNEIRRNSKETIDLGSEMTEKAEQINAVLESIELKDEEDVQGIGITGREYQKSFDGAFNEQVESAGQELEQQGEQLREGVEDELGNVRSGISKLERAGGISEIGSDASEAGVNRLEGSAGEYEDIISDAEAVSEETKQQIESLKNSLSGAFGK